MQKFSLRAEILRPLLLQRTEYQSKSHWLANKFLRRLYERHFLTILEKNRREEIAQLYFEDIRNDYRQIASHLPERVSTIVDVGSGLGGINVFLHEHYQDQKPFFHLVDRNQIDRVIHFFMSWRLPPIAILR